MIYIQSVPRGQVFVKIETCIAKVVTPSSPPSCPLRIWAPWRLMPSGLEWGFEHRSSLTLCPSTSHPQDEPLEDWCPVSGGSMQTPPSSTSWPTPSSPPFYPQSRWAPWGLMPSEWGFQAKACLRTNDRGPLVRWSLRLCRTLRTTTNKPLIIVLLLASVSGQFVFGNLLKLKNH